jgi:hypothetical protein
VGEQEDLDTLGLEIDPDDVSLLRLKLSAFVDRYFMYGRYGCVHIEEFLPIQRLLCARSVTTGEVVHIVPVMLEDRRELDGVEVIAWMAR